MLLRVGPEVQVGAWYGSSRDSLTILGYGHDVDKRKVRVLFAWQMYIRDCGMELAVEMRERLQHEGCDVVYIAGGQDREYVTILFSRTAKKIRKPRSFLRATKKILERIGREGIDSIYQDWSDRLNS